MSTVDRLNVQIEADASGLKKELNSSAAALEKLKQRSKELGDQLATLFSSGGNKAVNQISTLVEERNQIIKTIRGLESGTLDIDDIGVQSLINKIDEMRNNISTEPISVDIEADQTEPVTVEVDTSGTEKTKADLDEIQSKVKDIKKNWSEAFKNSNSSTSIKRIGLALLGVRSTFAAIRKSMNTYLGQNEELQNKINGIWYALGSLLAPVVNWLVNLFAKIVLYVDVFLKALGLAGINMSNLNKGATKLKKTISGFDELNIYQSDTTGGGATNPFEGVELNPDTVEFLTKLGETLRPVMEWLSQAFKDLFQFIEENLGLVLGIIGTIIGIEITAKIVEIGKKIKEIIDVIKLVYKFLTGGTVAATLGNILTIIGGIVLAVSSFIDMWKKGWNIIGEILKDLGIALAAVGAVALGICTGGVAAIVAAIVAALSTIVILVHDNWDAISAWCVQAWADFTEGWKEFWNGVGEWFKNIGEKIATFISETWTRIKEGTIAIFTSIGEFILSKWTMIKETVLSLVTALKTGVESIWNSLKANITNICNILHTTLSNVWNNIKTTASNIWNGIKNTVVNIANTISTSVTNVFNNMKTAIGNVFEGIKNFIKSPINAIIGFINKLVSGVTSGINGMINALNKLSFSVPSWVPGLGGKSFGFNLKTITAPQIPYLANGGVVDRPTVAMIGEAGREIVTPESLLQNIINKSNDDLADVYMQVGRQIISAIENQDLSVQIGDDTIARSAARGNKSYYNRTGKQLIKV